MERSHGPRARDLDLGSDLDLGVVGGDLDDLGAEEDAPEDGEAVAEDAGGEAPEVARGLKERVAEEAGEDIGDLQCGKRVYLVIRLGAV